ncbi:MAG: 50S ribosomal protein L30 [Thermoplasmata archaeon]
MAYAVVRLKSSRDKTQKTKDTLEMLRLNSVNHCTVIPESPTYKGMLKKVKDLITWGEIDIETMVSLLERSSGMARDELEEKISERTSYDKIDQFAIAVTSDKVLLSDIEGLDRVFRLNPPKGSYQSIKKAYNMGGALGYRGSDINSLIQKMLNSGTDQEV